VDAYLDDLQLVQLGDEVMKPPWDGQYKLRPDETARLTAADVVGPDGIVYPNWTRTGVQGDIPDVPEFCRIEDHGARADDDADDADALDLACVAAGEAGGGAVVLGAGIFELRGNHFPVSGSGLGMYVRAFDVEGEWINGEESCRHMDAQHAFREHLRVPPLGPKRSREGRARPASPQGRRRVRGRLHSHLRDSRDPRPRLHRRSAPARQ
jgi:hypothetical protein